MRLRINNVKKWKFSKHRLIARKTQLFQKDFPEFAIRSVVAPASMDEYFVLLFVHEQMLNLQPAVDRQPGHRREDWEKVVTSIP